MLDPVGSRLVRQQRTQQRTQKRLTAAALACVLIALGACQHDGRTLRPADPSQNASVFTPSTTTTIVDDSAQPIATDPIDTAIEGPGASFVIHAPFVDGGVIDAKYSCNAQALSPPISWTGAPAAAVSMALVVIDTDFNGFVHWVIAGLAPKGPGLLEGQVPLGAIEGTNGASTSGTNNSASTTNVPVTASPQNIGWRAMCPPKGSTHHYRFTLYALDQQIDLPNGSPAADLMAVIDSSSIQAAQITGVYTTP